MSKHNKNKAIPDFELYGESGDLFNRQQIHIENIEARSGGLNWQIQPHRHSRLFQIIIIFDGAARVSMDDNQYRVQDNAMFIIPSEVVHSFDFTPGCYGYVLSIQTAVLEHGLLNNFKSYQAICGQQAMLDISPERQLLSQYIEYFQTEFERIDSDSSSLMSLFLLVLGIAKRCVEEDESLSVATDNAPLRVTDSMRKLLERNYRKHWKVEQYAEALNVSPSTLNRYCRSVFRESAKDLIHRRVLVEAQRRLIYTRQNQQQIAFDLGFADPSYFARFFKRRTGVTPSEFRRREWL